MKEKLNLQTEQTGTASHQRQPVGGFERHYHKKEVMILRFSEYFTMHILCYAFNKNCKYI